MGAALKKQSAPVIWLVVGASQVGGKRRTAWAGGSCVSPSRKGSPEAGTDRPFAPSHKPDLPPNRQKHRALCCLLRAHTPQRSACPPHHTTAPATMAPRQKKEDTGELMVSIEQYTRTRDSVCVFLLFLLVLPFCDAPAHVVVSARHQGAHHAPPSPSAITISPFCRHVSVVASATRLQHRAVQDPAACFAPQAQLRCGRRRPLIIAHRCKNQNTHSKLGC
jgi:hypothetical protein